MCYHSLIEANSFVWVESLNQLNIRYFQMIYSIKQPKPSSEPLNISFSIISFLKGLLTDSWKSVFSIRGNAALQVIALKHRPLPQLSLIHSQNGDGCYLITPSLSVTGNACNREVFKVVQPSPAILYQDHRSMSLPLSPSSSALDGHYFIHCWLNK